LPSSWIGSGTSSPPCGNGREDTLTGHRVERRQLAGAALDVAPALLGALLTSDVDGWRVQVRITEVEAYEGDIDPASHAFRGPTKRNQVMFGPPGRLYTYFVYGMHWCANVVCGPAGTAAAVLLRAGEVLLGEDHARARTPTAVSAAKLASGPARLARCLGLSGAHTGLDLLDAGSVVRIDRLGTPAAHQVGPRVGVASAAEHPWRFWLPDDPTVSAYRPGGRSRSGANRQTGRL
jgi:DNA-3-methyladenine glycosylase